MNNIFTTNIKFYSVLLLFLLSSAFVKAQYTVNTAATATDLVNELIGEGVAVSNITMNCSDEAKGIFGGTGDLGIDSGIVLTSGTAEVFGAFTIWSNPTVSEVGVSDADLNALVMPNITHDACILEFDFIASGDSINFNYIFGSSEYGMFSCSIYNDVFAFFISGPGITGLQNMGVVPGTTIPVSVNSTTGVGAWVTSDTNCTSMGAGSPFTAFYVDNTSGAFVKYGGFTTVFNAHSAVTPCETYHLKLAIADAADMQLDSGVFLEGGSLNSNGITVTAVGGGGMSYPNSNAVRGCLPGVINVFRSGSTSTALTLDYVLDGTAVNGIDYTTLPLSVTIPVGANSAQVLIDPVVFSTLVGTRTVIAKIINPFACVDTLIADTIFIYDSLYVEASVQDTAVCLGETVNISINTHTYFDFSWSMLDDLTYAPDAYNVSITPSKDLEYVVSVNVIGSGCESVTDSIYINVIPKPNVTLTYSPLDELLCVLDTITLFGHGAAVYHYYDKDNYTLGSGDFLDVLLTNALNNFFVIGYDDNGCSNQANISIHAEPCCEMVIPTAFSPNGDGLNDAFGIVTDGNPSDFKLEIFNRWGDRIFISIKPHVKWNGTYENGKNADIGTYFYMVQGKCYDGSVFRKKGDVTLIR